MSSSTRKYDVFLSFRGEDTRNSFTSHLFNALKNKSIETYIDCLLDRGHDAWPALAKAIEDSHVSIVVFSENYASSKWCLEELVKILQCRKDRGQVVIPVFYGTDPSHIRNQSGSFETAFDKHERDLGDGDKDAEPKKQKIKSWKDALTEAANISGWDSRNQDESQLIGNIVNDVLRKQCLRHPTELKGLVGTEEICKTVELLMGKNKVIGIWGMPGIGKTTIAKVLFAKLFPQFDKVRFETNVKEYSLDRLLFELLKEETFTSNVVPFTYDMKRLNSKKVFIVLDDVNSSDQLENLHRGYLDLSEDSRLIITTRNKQLLKEVDWIHEVKKWNDAQSLQLFSLEAFKESHPQEGYEVLSAKAVEYAGGVPFALKVLGSCLRSQPIEYWESTLEKLKRYPQKKIQNFYKLSYDGLDYQEKQIFLDIAFFFKGEKKDHVISVLDACGFEARCGIVALQDKALISISDGTIEMHDLLQKMAFEIVRSECPEDPARRSRLRDTKEVHAILKDSKGTYAIEGIILDLSHIEEIHLSVDTFKKMKKLRFLKLYNPSDQCSHGSNIYLPGALESFYDKLAYLEWNRYSLESLPPTSCAKFLVEIRMPHSHIKQLWEGLQLQELGKLERIDLCECKQLIKLPDLSKAPRLKWVNLSGCGSLRVLHSSILSSDTLVTLILDRCTNLESVKGKKHLKSLQNISVNGCSSLKEFAVSSGFIESLVLSNTRIEAVDTSIGLLCKLGRLNIEGSRVKHIPKELSCLTSLKELKLSCSELIIDKQQLRVLFDGLQSLQILHLKNCSNLSEFPENIDALSKLQELRLDGSSVKSLPASIKNLQELEILSLKNCRKLRSLPELPPLIHEFYADNCTSLTSVSNLKSFAREMVGKTKRISFKNSLKLYEDSQVDPIMESLHLTMMSAAYDNVLVRKQHRGGYNYNSVEVCLPGDKLPFKSTKRKSKSSSIIIELSDSEWLGLIYCVVLSPSRGIKRDGAKIHCQCQLAGGSKAAWMNEAISELKSDHVFAWYDPLHCDNILRFHPPDVQFEFGVTNDKGEVDGSILIKECYVHPISAPEVESVLRELVLHPPGASVDEENMCGDTSIEDYSAQPCYIEEAKYSKENQNQTGRQHMVRRNFHDLPIEEPYQERQNETTGVVQQKENLVRQIVDAKKHREKSTPVFSSKELRHHMKEVSKQKKVEGDFARAAQIEDLSRGTFAVARLRDKGKKVEYNTGPSIDIDNSARPSTNVIIGSDRVSTQNSPFVAQGHEEITFPLKDPQMVLEILKDTDTPADFPASSLWDKRFPTTEFADKHVLNPHDRSVMKGLGGPALCRWLEVQALRSVSVARYTELEFEAAERSIAEKEEELRVAREEKVKMEGSLKVMEGRISQAASLEERVEDLNSQVAYWKRKYEQAQQKLEEWQEKEASWEARESELKTEAGVQLVRSFQNCMLQVWTLYPDIDLSRLGAFKVIQNGEIVSSYDSEETNSDEDTIA